MPLAGPEPAEVAESSDFLAQFFAAEAAGAEFAAFDGFEICRIAFLLLAEGAGDRCNGPRSTLALAEGRLDPAAVAGLWPDLAASADSLESNAAAAAAESPTAVARFGAAGARLAGAGAAADRAAAVAAFGRSWF